MLIELRKITKNFGKFTALDGIDLQVGAGEFVAIVGKSGSGKSTLLNILAGIDSPTRGEVLVNEVQVHRLNQDQVAVWRGRNVGIVFQFFQLLPTLTVLENVMLPMDFCKMYRPRERKERAENLLHQFDILDQANKLPATLSGGQQQRAAMARALANDPPIVVADEPTGNLDSYTADLVLQKFQDFAGRGKTVVMVTHERDISRMVTRSVTLVDGKLGGSSVQDAS